MANQLFKERWQRQWRQFAKYLKYVFNDHAILALVFLLGAGLVSYQRFWSTLAVTVLNQSMMIMMLLLTTLLFRTPATFIKEEDPIYFLGDESILRRLRQQAMLYSLAIRFVIQVLILLVLLPVLVQLFGQSPSTIIALAVLTISIALVVMYVTGQKVERFSKTQQAGQMLNWVGIAQLETKRVQRIIHIFSWFVDIPEQKVSIKTHAWSDWLIAHWPKAGGLTNLYITTFFRANDFVQLWLTIVALGSVLMATLSGWLLLGMLMSLMYIFIIQVLPIMIAYRQRVFDHLLPVTVQQRKQAFRRLSVPLVGLMLLLWFVVGLVILSDIKMVVMIEFSLVLWGLALVFLYSDRKAENMFKRR